jgi:hypothetical protein
MRLARPGRTNPRSPLLAGSGDLGFVCAVLLYSCVVPGQGLSVCVVVVVVVGVCLCVVGASL